MYTTVSGTGQRKSHESKVGCQDSVEDPLITELTDALSNLNTSEKRSSEASGWPIPQLKPTWGGPWWKEVTNLTQVTSDTCVQAKIPLLYGLKEPISFLLPQKSWIQLMSRMTSDIRRSSSERGMLMAVLKAVVPLLQSLCASHARPFVPTAKEGQPRAKIVLVHGHCASSAGTKFLPTTAKSQIQWRWQVHGWSRHWVVILMKRKWLWVKCKMEEIWIHLLTMILLVHRLCASGLETTAAVKECRTGTTVSPTAEESHSDSNVQVVHKCPRDKIPALHHRNPDSAPASNSSGVQAAHRQHGGNICAQQDSDAPKRLIPCC